MRPDGCKRANKHPDGTFGRRKLPKLVGQIVRRLTIPSEPRASSTPAMLVSVSSSVVGHAANQRHASSMRPAGPASSPGRVSSRGSRSAASSSTRSACLAVTAAAASASR